MITQLLSDETTTVSNDRLAAAVQRLTNVRRWFEVLATTSRTAAEVRARIEDAQAVAEVLAVVRSQAEEIALLRAGPITAVEQTGRPGIT
ncbi:hypothetical protein [Brevundimonas sp. NPDC058933]|uniref:hypothetical protein n=1 Tax=Brevundimonas sp. NPDC058933 TaxID=3346673 RepID=UPI003BEF08C3